MIRVLRTSLLAGWCLLLPFFACAQTPAAPEAAVPDPQEMALAVAVKAAQQALQVGPQNIPLAGQAVLKLPEHFGYIPATQAAAYLEALGNTSGDTLAGLVVPVDGQKGDWFVVIEYVPSGYIEDSDAKEWDADGLLESLREGTAAGNEQRATMGIPALEIVGWVETPQYDAAARRLVWSIASRSAGDAPDTDNGINYNTYALGREGYFSLNLVTARSTVAADKLAVNTLLGALEFDAGKRYADFNPETDKVAEYGLAALVAGAAVKKLGLLAAAAVFLAKFWKLLLIGAVGVGAIARKFMRKKTV